MENQLNSVPINKKIKLDFKDSKYATGRRKKSIAKVWLKKGSGNIHVNGKIMPEYFKKQNLQMAISRPLTIVKREREFDVVSRKAQKLEKELMSTSRKLDLMKSTTRRSGGGVHFSSSGNFASIENSPENSSVEQQKQALLMKQQKTTQVDH